MKFDKNKIILIFALVSTVILFFGVGFFIGKESKKPHKVASRKAIDEMFPEFKNCLDDYGNYARAWDCSSGANLNKKRCAISLTVKSGNADSGTVYLDGTLIKTKYLINGLTQSWIFENGSSFNLEPNGTGEYKKSHGKTYPLNFSSYTCSVVKK